MVPCACVLVFLTTSKNLVKPEALDRRIGLHKYDYGVLLIMMPSAVRLLVAGGFVGVFCGL